jgi:O-acetyl-ADP-ribose deacetylase (regulator of RNase III)
MKIVAVRGDITQVDVDAVVHPVEATSSGTGEPPFFAHDDLVERAGFEVEAEAAARGPIHVGEAILTTGGDLRCKYVIHAPVAQASDVFDPDDPEGIKRSTLAALRCAAGSRLRSVAIPASAHWLGAPEALISALRDFDAEGGLEEVFIVGENGEIVKAIKKAIGSGN